jgi:hypothetical protein
MVVSKAFGTTDSEMKKTSLLRHVFIEEPAVTSLLVTHYTIGNISSKPVPQNDVNPTSQSIF